MGRRPAADTTKIGPARIRPDTRTEGYWRVKATGGVDRTFATYECAEAFAIDLAAERRTGQVDPGRKVSFSMAATDLLARNRKQEGTTKDRIKSSLRVHLEPIVGGMSVASTELGTKVQAILDDMHENGYAWDSIDTVRRHAVRVVSWARDPLGAIPSGVNPLAGLVTPGAEPDIDGLLLRQVTWDDVPTVEESEKWALALDAIDRRWGFAARLARRSGLRYGEMIAVGVGPQANVVDTAPDGARIIRVNWQLRERASGAIELVPPKHKKRRVVGINADLADQLEDWIAVSGCDGRPFADCGRYWLDGPRGGHPRRSNVTNRIVTPARVASGYEDAFHALRHLYALQFLRNGGDVMDLSLNLGHSSRRVTELVYLGDSSDRPGRAAAVHVE